ncbi:amino acid--ACP ligase [Paenibacillus oenotherae]|uniref:Amino acid--ACP ligase n=1 Tax=Paenibacillus oenotherae TaxID=1435645 RepID=A0ABS7D9E8_9BACL|nr:aminoacyl--tRNA ligase-related protein [Paenibacillus oenotherae]MBW7476490.1 amino acid--ACP ligase [Paenibacillus oenotherae]
MNYTLPTTGKLKKSQAEALASRLNYCIEELEACHLDEETGVIHLSLREGTNLQELEPVLNKLLEAETEIRTLSSRVLLSTGTGERGVDHSGDVETVYSFDGKVRAGLAVTLSDAIDRIFRQFGLEQQAQLRKYSSMIDIEALNQCNYIETFPHNIHLVSEIPHQLDQLERVRSESDLNDIARVSKYALSPAVCFHCYRELMNSSIESPLVLTALGNCFRHESAWRVGRHRLNEFHMREIVFLGEAGFVEETRTHYIDKVWQLFNDLGFEGRIETASDPFYFSEDASKGQHQMMANMKYELIVELPAGQFSIASFNHMGDSLCKKFNISDRSGKSLQSGCTAFGVDRWVYGLLSRHGIQYSEWPASVRKRLDPYFQDDAKQSESALLEPV